MPDKYNFNMLRSWGNIETRCIEEGCDVGGPLWQWEENKRKEHFLMHNMQNLEALFHSGMMGASRKDTCRICGNDFEQEKKRGRPRTTCYICNPIEVKNEDTV